MEVERLYKVYVSYLEAKYKEKTVKQYRERLRSFLIFLEAQQIVHLNEVTILVINNYKKQLSTLKTNARYVYLEQVKKLLSYLYENSYCFVDLSLEIDLPKWERKKKNEYSKKEITAFLNKVIEDEPFKTRNKCILALYLYEGLSTGEIYSFTILDIDIPNGEIRLTKKKKFKVLKAETCKRLSRYLLKRNNLKPRNDYLFIANGGKRLGQQAISKAVNQIK